MHRTLLLAAPLLLIAETVSGQAVARAYTGSDNKAHIVFSSGKTLVIPPEPQQVGCEQFSIAPDGRTVGWAVLIDNCCTSYPIPVTLVLLRDRKKTTLSTGQMIWQWHFTGTSSQIALLTGPTHGWASEAGLYDSRSGKKIADWHGQGGVPSWAEAWEDQFEH